MIVHASCTYDGKAVHVEQAPRESMEQKIACPCTHCLPSTSALPLERYIANGYINIYTPGCIFKIPRLFSRFNLASTHLLFPITV